MYSNRGTETCREEKFRVNSLSRWGQRPFEVVVSSGKRAKALVRKGLYSCKINHDGFVTKPKARFATKPKARFACLGDFQRSDVGFDYAFAPSPLRLAPRVLTARACQDNLEMCHLLVERAFIQSLVEEEILRLGP